MNLTKLMNKHSNERMTPKHFKFSDSITNHMDAFLDGQLTNVERKYRTSIREIDLEGKRIPDQLKIELRNTAEIDLLAKSEILSILKIKMDEAKQEIENIKSIHLNKIL